MNENFTYDPEDLESLLMHKPFDELYEEEKAFVLRHMDSEQEYESMRAMLVKIVDGTGEEQISPNPKIKEELLELFVKEERKGISWWLNHWFAILIPPQAPRLRRIAIPVGMAVIAIFSVVFFTQDDFTSRGKIAEAHTAEVEEREADTKEEIKTNANSEESSEEKLSDDMNSVDKSIAGSEETIDSDQKESVTMIVEDAEMDTEDDMAQLAELRDETQAKKEDFNGSSDDREAEALIGEYEVSPSDLDGIADVILDSVGPVNPLSGNSSADLIKNVASAEDVAIADELHMANEEMESDLGEATFAPTSKTSSSRTTAEGSSFDFTAVENNATINLQASNYSELIDILYTAY